MDLDPDALRKAIARSHIKNKAPEGRSLSSLPVCGVLAVSQFAGISFTRAYEIIGQDKTRNWKGRTREADRQKILDIAGISYTVRDFASSLSVVQFAEYSTWPRRQYMIEVTGHVLFLDADGILHDQTQSVIPSRHNSRNQRVKRVYERLLPCT